MPTSAPYGSWQSPISGDLAAGGALRLSTLPIHLDGDDIYWSEPRPREQGRNVIMRRRADGSIESVTPPGFNARTTVHEYGGGAFAVAGGVVVFANYADQRLYRHKPGEEPQPITPALPLRYADFVIDLRRRRILAVREDHRDAGREPVNALVSVNLDGDAEGGALLAEGADFYAAPRLSPDGGRLAWIEWRHPNMPWDGTDLYVAAVRPDGLLGERQHIAGGPTESVVIPDWSPWGALHFVSDRDGWWNLYRWRDGRLDALWPMEAEFGVPLWGLGVSTCGFLSENRLATLYIERGVSRLGVLDTAAHTFTPIDTPYTDMASLRAAPGRVVFAAASPRQTPCIVQWTPASGVFETLREPAPVSVNSRTLSEPDLVEFPTTGGRTAFAFYYPPTNPDYTGLSDEKPPLIVISHGGPTSATAARLDLGMQFWTSRGFGVLDVNYGGSTGYGTAYRRRLNGQWGIVDTEDCIAGARYLAEQGRVDSDRLVIRGGSAGGYTTLCALTFHDVFKAGASYYGVSDLAGLDDPGHKFESRYNHSLIGGPDVAERLYAERSPIHHTQRLNCPMIFFQGLEDRVVPPDQSERMVDALRAKGIPVAYVPFEGEQHGFRRAENIKRALEAELYFYAQVFGFDLVDDIEPVAIENLSSP